MKSQQNYSGTQLDETLFLKACKRGEVIFLFDGLDEISNETNRQEIIKELETLILMHKNCAFVITSRYEKYGSPDNSFLAQIKYQTICELNPLTFEEQKELIKKLYSSLIREINSDKEKFQDNNDQRGIKFFY